MVSPGPIAVRSRIRIRLAVRLVGAEIGPRSDTQFQPVGNLSTGASASLLIKTVRDSLFVLLAGRLVVVKVSRLVPAMISNELGLLQSRT